MHSMMYSAKAGLIMWAPELEGARSHGGRVWHAAARCQNARRLLNSLRPSSPAKPLPPPRSSTRTSPQTFTIYWPPLGSGYLRPRGGIPGARPHLTGTSEARRAVNTPKAPLGTGRRWYLVLTFDNGALIFCCLSYLMLYGKIWYLLIQACPPCIDIDADTKVLSAATKVLPAAGQRRMIPRSAARSLPCPVYLA
ncbi:hypothetical protein PENSPDRAFT_321461 [Peniophora sp. CONT]|nr:hypothetical protein PENSPDRAFT_321461 [Peniophora sp. CONT]